MRRGSVRYTVLSQNLCDYRPQKNIGLSERSHFDADWVSLMNGIAIIREG